VRPSTKRIVGGGDWSVRYGPDLGGSTIWVHLDGEFTGMIVLPNESQYNLVTPRFLAIRAAVSDIECDPHQVFSEWFTHGF